MKLLVIYYTLVTHHIVGHKIGKLFHFEELVAVTRVAQKVGGGVADPRPVDIGHGVVQMLAVLSGYRLVVIPILPYRQIHIISTASKLKVNCLSYVYSIVKEKD